jgi:hypothetical protein
MYFNNGATAQRHNGTKAQWHISIMAQRRNGTMAQWNNDQMEFHQLVFLPLRH